MSDVQPQSYTVNCAILGKNTLFSVEIASNETVHELKKKIKGKNPNRFASVDANELTLYRVDIAGSRETMTEELKKLADDFGERDELHPLHKLSKFYSTAPPKGTVHILVQPPQTGQNRGLPGKDTEQGDQVLAPQMRRIHNPRLAAITSFTAKRDLTVDALYQRLIHYRLVMVRGTPASGKTTLAQLLAHHIRAQEPGADPILIGSWPRDGSNWFEKLTTKYKPDGSNTIIIDEAQLTYWDTGFWNTFLKPITPESLDRIILFASYGNPGIRVSAEGTSMVISDRYRVSLRPVDHGDGIASAGLFLTADEFADMVKRRYPEGCFKEDFLKYVFRVTAGHTGAVADLIRIVMADTSYRRLDHEDREYSLEIFQSQFSIAELWSRLDSSSIFRCGLPMLGELQEPPVARVFREVLRNNNVRKRKLELKEDRDALEQCFSWGWLHATTDQKEFQYIFTTPLHQWFVEYYLGTRLSDPTLVADQDLRTFTIEVMRRFSPRRLSSPRRFGASNVQRPPEAQFQDEFYRCCHEYSKGSLISFPEYGGATGRVDLYIPLKKWGVELLRDEDRLENHSSRFTGLGAYAKMQLEDYIILDFRKVPPTKSYPGIPNLYHVVFKNDDYKHVEILKGSSLEMVDKFELLNS